MNKVFKLSLLLLFPVLSFAQEKGIKFQQGLNWEQIQAKAKNENKYIFVDCFATWCGPCKKMDQDVYTSQMVGNYFNDRFISVKVQMDTSKNDNSDTKTGYLDAHMLMEKYKIYSYPSFLFFSPNGNIVLKEIGFRNEKNIIDLAGDALDPKKQYYTLLANYLQGKRDYSTMTYLVNSALKLNELDVAAKVGNDYINNYLIHLDDSSLYKEDNLAFLAFFTKTSNDKGFSIFYKNTKKINKIVKSKVYAQVVVDNIIVSEIIKPIVEATVKSGETPDWQKIYTAVKIKYNSDYANRTVLDYKIIWYYSKKDMANYAKTIVKRVEKYGPYGICVYDFDLNNNAWEVFKYSNNKADLTKALAWSDEAIKHGQEGTISIYNDTKANILYKLGKSEEAVAIEKYAISLSANSSDFCDTLIKMEKGEPTWTVHR